MKKIINNINFNVDNDQSDSVTDFILPIGTTIVNHGITFVISNISAAVETKNKRYIFTTANKHYLMNIDIEQAKLIIYSLELQEQVAGTLTIQEQELLQTIKTQFNI
jgi:hypothetical protein